MEFSLQTPFAIWNIKSLGLVKNRLFVEWFPYGKGLFVKGIPYWKGYLQMDFFMKCLLEQALCRVVSLWQRHLCKGNSVLKRLFVNGFLYGKGLLEQALCRVVSLWKRHLCKGNSLLKRLFVKGFLYGTGLLEQALCRVVYLLKKASLKREFFM